MILKRAGISSNVRLGFSIASSRAATPHTICPSSYNVNSALYALVETALANAHTNSGRGHLILLEFRGDTCVSANL